MAIEVKVSEKCDPFTGLYTFLSWENPELIHAIRQLAGQRSREELVALIVDQRGIRPIFEYREPPTSTTMTGDQQT